MTVASVEIGVWSTVGSADTSRRARPAATAGAASCPCAVPNAFERTAAPLALISQRLVWSTSPLIASSMAIVAHTGIAPIIPRNAQSSRKRSVASLNRPGGNLIAVLLWGPASSANTKATVATRRRPAGGSISLRPDIGRPDHLGPFFGIFGGEPDEVGTRTRKHFGAQLGKPCLHPGIVEARIDFFGRIASVRATCPKAARVCGGGSGQGRALAERALQREQSQSNRIDGRPRINSPLTNNNANQG
jgi:hypothetical protein